MAIDKGHLQHVYKEEDKISLQVFQIASGEIKISFNKSEKIRIVSVALVVNTLRYLEKLLKMGVMHLSYRKEFCGSESCLSAPRPHETYRVEAKAMVTMLPHREVLPVPNFELRAITTGC